MYVLAPDSASFGVDHKTNIHPTAIVHGGAKLGVGVTVGPFTLVGPKVTLHDNVHVGAHVVIGGRTSIGEGSRVWPFATLGSEPQDLKYKGDDTCLNIGPKNLIREYVNISLGTMGGGGETAIGSGNLFMVNSHVAHDCFVGDNCVFANGTALAGHVHIGSRVVLGGMAGVHQFCKVGDLAMLAGGAMVVQDVMPFCIVHGDRARVKGLNTIGLTRAGFSKSQISSIKTMYRILVREHLSLTDAVKKVREEVGESTERDMILKFVESSSRGFCRRADS